MTPDDHRNDQFDGLRILSSAIRGSGNFKRELLIQLLRLVRDSGATWAAASFSVTSGELKWTFAGSHPDCPRCPVGSRLTEVENGESLVEMSGITWTVRAVRGQGAAVYTAWPSAAIRLQTESEQYILLAVEAASLRAQATASSSTRNGEMERASHEVRNSLFTLRRMVELEAIDSQTNPSLTSVLGRIEALSAIYGHLSDHSFERADVRPLIVKMVPECVTVRLPDNPIEAADRQARWLAQAIHECTHSATAIPRQVALETDDGILDVCIDWKDPIGGLAGSEDRVRIAIAGQLVRDGLGGRLDDTDGQLHLRCELAALRRSAGVASRAVESPPIHDGGE